MICYNVLMEDLTNKEDVEILEEVEIIENPSKKFKKRESRNYMDPSELHRLLKEHVIKRSINTNHRMTDALGKMIIKLVDEYSNSGKYRSYFNGWKYEMKSQAYEHICRYAHAYNIHYTDSIDFFLKWLFRDKEHLLDEWFAARLMSYKDFKDGLPIKMVKTPNGKDKTKMAKIISEAVLIEYVEKKSQKYDPSTFKEEFFSKRPELVGEFKTQVEKNSFNYLTQFTYHAFIAVIKREKMRSEQQQTLNEGILYKTDSPEEDIENPSAQFTTMDDNRIDWGSSLVD